MEYTKDALNKWTVAKLREELRKRGLKVSGVKDVLIKRLLQNLNTIAETDETVRVVHRQTQPVTHETKAVNETHGALSHVVMLERVRLSRLREENFQTRFWVLCFLICLAAFVYLITILLPPSLHRNLLN